MLLPFCTAIAPEDMNQALLRTAATICLALGVLFGSAGCSGDPKLVRHRPILDDAGQPVDFVCVIPAYFKVSGVSFGPDGTGRKTAEDVYLKRPFKFRSGEDFAAHVVPNETRIVPIPPLIAFGDAVTPSRFLLIRGGFNPVLLRGHERHMREPFVLKRSQERLPDELLELLTEQKDDQVMLRKYFKPEESVQAIRFEYSSTDIDVVKSCLWQSEAPEKHPNNETAPRQQTSVQNCTGIFTKCSAHEVA
jgi:hypothetical protein